MASLRAKWLGRTILALSQGEHPFAVIYKVPFPSLQTSTLTNPQTASEHVCMPGIEDRKITMVAVMMW